jgi:outer membrane protein assembly factor BamB
VAYEGVPKIKRHPKATHASSTPATDGKHVVALFGAEGLYCYDANGKLLWKQDLGTMDAGWFYDPDYQWGHASSPIIYKNLVIVQADIQKDSFIAAYDLKTGKRMWTTPREEIPSWGTPTVYEGKTRAELIANATKFIRGYDPMTAKNCGGSAATPRSRRRLRSSRMI